jgi:hypothetical protein
MTIGKLGMVVYARNPSYSGGPWSEAGVRLEWAKTGKILSEKQPKSKRTGGMAQMTVACLVFGPEFNS